MQQLKHALRRPLAASLRGLPHLKRLPRWWPIPAGVLVVAVVVAGTLLLTKGAGGANGALQVYTVARGNISASVACTGEVYAPRRADLSFDVTKVPLIELNVVAGQQVKAGDVLARIDPTSLQRAVDQAQADLIVAQDALEQAKTPYSDLDLTKARLTVSQNEVALAEAQAALKELLDPDIASAQAAVDDAEAALTSAQAQMTQVENDSSNAAQIRTLEYEAHWYEQNYAEAQVKFQKGEIDQQKLDFEYSNMLAAQERLRVAQAKAQAAVTNAQSSLAKAQRAYQEAQDALAELQRGPGATELAKARNAVTLAQYNLDVAEEELARAEAGPAEQDVKVAQAKVDSAQATLEEAQATLAAATMVAPFDGTVVSVGAEVGDLVSSGTTIITLADLGELRVKAVVDETDIANVQIGQVATVTFDAFPGSRFKGKVLEVPLQGSLSQNILTYEVPVSLEGAGQEVALKPGMTANVSIAVGQGQNVLLVPAMAVQQGEAGNVVLVQDDPGKDPVETPVTLGLSDGVYVEIKRGLNEGDRVVFEYSASTSSSSQPQWMQRGGPGSFGVQVMPSGPVEIRR